MKKILLVLAVTALLVSSCGMKTTAQGEETTAVEATTETPAEEAAEKSCCDKDSTKACCEKDSLTAVSEDVVEAEEAE